MDFNEYIKPELMILIPVLIIIGKLIKSSAMDSKHIPLVLGSIGAVLSCLWVLGNSGENTFHGLFTGVIQGILCAGAAVYGNQILKQCTKE